MNLYEKHLFINDSFLLAFIHSRSQLQQWKSVSKDVYKTIQIKGIYLIYTQMRKKTLNHNHDNPYECTASVTIVLKLCFIVSRKFRWGSWKETIISDLRNTHHPMKKQN